MMHAICQTCGTQYEGSPEHCAVCEDERQYVGFNGQHWTDHDRLKQAHTLRLGDESGVLGLGLSPAFAINQRALFLPTDAGNILWECLGMVTDATVDELNQRGGLDLIVISHPHFYTAMQEWSEAFGNIPIVLHEADREWITRPSANVQFWHGENHRLSDTVTLINTGGHFPGSTALHWKNGPRSGGALFSGDSPQVASDRRHVSFMYSYPNLVPLDRARVLAMRERLAGYAFEDVYGYTWGRNIIGDGRAAVDTSFQRYLSAIAA